MTSVMRDAEFFREHVTATKRTTAYVMADGGIAIQIERWTTSPNRWLVTRFRIFPAVVDSPRVRVRALHGWAFRDHTPAEVEKLRKYLDTGWPVWLTGTSYLRLRRLAAQQLEGRR